MTSAGTSTEHADFGADVGQGTQQLIGAVEIAEHLFVGNTAAGSDFGADVFRCAMAVAEIEIGRDCGVAVVGESAGAFTIPFIPTRRVVDDNHARVWAGAERPGDIGIDRIAFVALHGNGFGEHAVILIRKSISPLYTKPTARATSSN